MSKTKLQNFIFTVVMAFAMVYAMICYNIAINIGGMRNQVFWMAFEELIVMLPIAILLELCVVEKLAHKMTFQILDPQKDRPLMITLVMCSLIVCLMCPMMSLVATLLFKGVGIDMIGAWIQTTVINFPMALGWQIFFAGPLIRFLFQTMREKWNLA